MIATEAKHDYTSIGQLAAHLQRSVREIQRAADQLGIAAALRLNHVAHFDANQGERLTAHFRELKDKAAPSGHAENR